MKKNKIRFAVVGLGHISQEAVLPAFESCRHSELTALVSGDQEKLKVLGKKYGVENLLSYDELERLNPELVDAVYIATPNHLHREHTIRCARRGLHVLCEKPMAVTARECEEMIEACDEAAVKLMIAYRLHFEEANLTAVDLINRKKKLGEPKLFQSLHTQAADYPNIRTQPIEMGGGPTYDVGIYDINAARYIFQDEPIAVAAVPTVSSKAPYQSIEESMSVILKFPGERIASLLYSFGSAKTDTFRVAGTKGDLTLDHAYTYHGGKQLILNTPEGKREKSFKERDHFAAEIDYFSRCISKNRAPEPSGIEGLADVRIIEAIFQAAIKSRLIELNPTTKTRKPDLRLETKRRKKGQATVVRAKAPSRKVAA